MMEVIVTGFEPFGTLSTNPSWEAVQALPTHISGCAVRKLLLPTVFGRCFAPLQQAIEQHHPAAVLCVGVAQLRNHLTPERVAINLRDTKVPDNEGYHPTDEPIIEDAPTAFFSSLPVKAMVKAMQESHLPAKISNSAGTYVCNEVLYRLLHFTQAHSPQTLAGFIHVPLPQNDTTDVERTLTLNDLTQALQLCLETIVLHLQQTTHSECRLCPP